VTAVVGGASLKAVTDIQGKPESGATQLMIRSPKNYHAPKHWHTANETHTVIYGTFIMQHDGGQKEALGPGSYNRMPSKMIHEAWSPPDEGNLVFITVDGPWDLNLVDGPTGKMPPK
jgi:quercetin dioxygenase-like cupin family protein